MVLLQFVFFNITVSLTTTITVFSFPSLLKILIQCIYSERTVPVSCVYAMKLIQQESRAKRIANESIYDITWHLESHCVAWCVVSNHYCRCPSVPSLWQNTVDKLIKKTNLALLVGTNSWRDQFIEAITVSAGKAHRPEASELDRMHGCV